MGPPEFGKYLNLADSTDDIDQAAEAFERALLSTPRGAQGLAWSGEANCYGLHVSPTHGVSRASSDCKCRSGTRLAALRGLSLEARAGVMTRAYTSPPRGAFVGANQRPDREPPGSGSTGPRRR